MGIFLGEGVLRIKGTKGPLYSTGCRAGVTQQGLVVRGGGGGRAKQTRSMIGKSAALRDCSVSYYYHCSLRLFLLVRSFIPVVVLDAVLLLLSIFFSSESLP